MRSLRPVLCVLCLLWLGSLPGCLDNEFIAFGEIGWNETVKPILEAVSPDEIPLLFQSEGGQRGDEIASEVDWSTLARGADRLYGHLPASRCLWVEEGGFPIFTWDATLDDLDVRDGDGRALKLSTHRVSFAGGWPTDPLTREVLQIDGEPVASFVPPNTFTVLMRRFTEASKPPHPFAPCVRHDASPSIADLGAEGCDASHENSALPLAGIRCAKPAAPGDVTYEVQAAGSLEMKDVEIEDRVIRTSPHTLEPTLMKVPDAGRRIARPLAFMGVEMVNASCEDVPVSYRSDCVEREKYENDKTPEPPHAEWLWRWFTPSLEEDGEPILDRVDPKGTRWEENWAPGAPVSEVGVFRYLGLDRETGRPVTEDVSPRRIHLNREQLASRHIDCVPDPGSDEPDVCTRFFPDDAGLLVTPGYLVGALGIGERGTAVPKLEWIAEFRVYPDEFGEYALPEVLPAEDLFVRFDLSSACASCLSAYVQPEVRDLGDVRLAKQSVFERTFQITNSGTTSIWVDSLGLSGPSALDFEIGPHRSVALPVRVAPGDALELDLFFRSDQYGVHSATAEAVVRANGHVRTLRAPVVLRAVDAIPHVIPDRVDLWDFECPEVWQGWTEKNALVENAGHLDLDVRSVTIEGPDASLFAMARRVGDTLLPVSDESLAPGDAAEYRLFYLAPQPGAPAPERQARVRFETNGGDATIDLRGHACPY